MRLFSNNIVPYASTEGDKIYPIVVDIKKGIKSGEAISFVTADNQVGVITVDFMDGNSSYSIEGCMVTSTIHRPDGTVLEIPCDIISQSTIEIPLGINGTYQEGVHTFDLKIVRGNGKVIGVPTMSYSVSGSLSSDDVVEGDDRLPVLTMMLDNAQDKLTRLDKAIAGATNDLEVKEARDGEVTLNARLERDLAKGKIHFVDVEGSNIATESQEGYLENVEIYGNTWQDTNNLSDIRSVGTRVDGQELYKIDVVSCGKNLFNIDDVDTVTFGFSNTDYTVTSISGNHKFARFSLPQGTYTYQADVGDLYPSGWSLFVFESDEKDIYVGKQYHLSAKYQFNGGKVTRTFTASKKYQFIHLSYNETKDIPKIIQLEEGTVATPYEPYQEDKLTILSPTPLEKVGDVADRIICKDGVWGVEKNTQYNWDNLNLGAFSIGQFNEDDITGKYDVFRINNDFINKGIYPFIKLGRTNYNETFKPYDGECVWGTVGYTYFKILKGKTNLEDFKLGKSFNFVVIKDTPQFIPLPHDQQVKLRTFANKTNIHFETEIEPTIKAQVPKSLGATVNTHTTQIDNLNKELDRVKKLEESTVTTVITDKAFTTVAETTGGYFEDVKIEGKTLVNKMINPSSYSSSDGKLGFYWSSNYIYSAKNCYDIRNISKNITVISTSGKPLEVAWLSDNGSTVVYGGSLGKDIVCKYINLPSNATSIAFYGLESNGWSIDNIKQANILLLEGDHTDKDITFFEGLKSVGQDTDEISVLSASEDYLGLEQGSMYTTTGEFTESETRVRSALIPYNSRTDINIDFSKFKVIFFEYDYSRNFIYSDGGWKNSNCTLSDQCKYYRVLIAKLDNSKLTVDEVKDEKLNKKQILYYNPTTQTWEKPVLREWDSIEKYNDGKYYYHKRSGEIVLNGSESWNIRTDLDKDNSSLFTLNIGNGFGGSNDTNCISNRFIASTSIYSNDTEGFYRNAGYIYIRINKSKLSTQDVAGFKQWLQANPTTVVYQLAQEEVYECTNLDLITYQNETNLIVNSGAIQPRITLKVLNNVSNVVKLLQEKVSVLENKFIEGLKQVLSGNMMALAQLLYPEDFGNNHEIQTLEL